VSQENTDAHEAKKGGPSLIHIDPPLKNKAAKRGHIRLTALPVGSDDL
jgi:hypothetical protein